MKLDPDRTLVLQYRPGTHPTGRLPAATGYRIDYLTPNKLPRSKLRGIQPIRIE